MYQNKAINSSIAGFDRRKCPKRIKEKFSPRNKMKCKTWCSSRSEWSGTIEWSASRHSYRIYMWNVNERYYICIEFEWVSAANFRIIAIYVWTDFIDDGVVKSWSMQKVQYSSIYYLNGNDNQHQLL